MAELEARLRKAFSEPTGWLLGAEHVDEMVAHLLTHLESTGPRAYVIGLPVVITVHDDGRVEFSVDVSEASDLWEAFADPDDAYPTSIVEADIARVDAATAHQYLPTVTLSPTTPQEPNDA